MSAQTLGSPNYSRRSQVKPATVVSWDVPRAVKVKVDDFTVYGTGTEVMSCTDLDTGESIKITVPAALKDLFKASGRSPIGNLWEIVYTGQGDPKAADKSGLKLFELYELEVSR